MGLTKKQIEFLNLYRTYMACYKLVHGKEPEYVMDYINGWVYAIDTGGKKKPIGKSVSEFFQKYIDQGKIVFKERVWKFRLMTEELYEKTDKQDMINVIEKRIEKSIGKEAFQALKDNRALLHIWRRTCPHNVWVEDNKGETLWHSGERNSIGTHYFKEVSSSKTKIERSLNPHEIGTSDHSVYELDIERNTSFELFW